MLGLGSSLLSPYLAEEAGYNNTHSLLLDGANDNFDTNFSAQTILRAAPSDGFTVSFWANPDTTGRSFLGSTAVPSTSGQLVFMINSGALLTLIRSNNKAGLEQGGSVALNEWHMYSLVISAVGAGSGSDFVDMSHFVDGVDVNSTSSFNNTTYDDLALISLPDLAIGSQAEGSASNVFDGHIDQFAIWNRAVPEAHLAALAAHPGHDYTTDSGDYASSAFLEVYYKFDNNANDSSGNGHNGETVNGASFDTNLPS
jgi:hypothetical protein